MTRGGVCHNRRNASLCAAGGRADCPVGALRRPCRARCRSTSEAPVPHHDAAERPDGGAVRGSLDADRPPADLVSRRLEERAAGPHRLRAPVRAHDVQGLEERRARGAHARCSRRSAARATPTRPRTRRCSGRRCRRSTCRSMLWLEADRMATLRIDKDTFANEREVVKEERRMRVDNQPYGRLNEIIYDQAFTMHPYKHPTIGSMAGPRGRVGRRRARLLPDVLRAGERDAGDRRRLRHRAGAAARAAVPRPRAEGRPSRCRATSRRSRRRRKEKRVTLRGAVAAAGGRRRVPHHLRRQPRLLSAAHRVEGAVRRAELAHLPEAGLRDSSSRVAAFGGAQPHRGSEPVLSPSRSCSPATRRQEVDRRAHRASSIGCETEPITRARAAAREEPVRARLHPRPRVGSAEGAAARRTPSSSTTTSRRPTASSTSSRTSRPPTCSASRKTYFTPENRLVLTLMPKAQTQ